MTLDLAKLLERKTVLAIMGPTASGKTALALNLADSLPLEIISVDSALIYRGMDIGTAKPSQTERAKVPHHLIDILDPAESYSAADFVTDCKRLVDEIHQRGCIPALVGGTMMYFHALQQGLAELPSAEPAIRQALQAEYEKDAIAMHQRLAQLDPVAAERIHFNDPQRLIRALEVYQISGETLTALQAKQTAASWSVNLIKIGLIPQDRAKLHQQITRRLDQMFQHGFVDEVKTLYQRADLHSDLPAIRCVGYRQAWSYLAGETDLETCYQKALVATRQLAKRQLTWLRKEQALLVLDPFEITQQQACNQALAALAEKS